MGAPHRFIAKSRTFIKKINPRLKQNNYIYPYEALLSTNFFTASKATEGLAPFGMTTSKLISLDFRANPLNIDPVNSKLIPVNQLKIF